MDPSALDRKSGVFTAPQAGVYLITFSLYAYSEIDRSRVGVIVLKDGNEMTTTGFETGTGDGRTPLKYQRCAGQSCRTTTTTKTPTINPVSTTSGRAVYERLKAG